MLGHSLTAIVLGLALTTTASPIVKRSVLTDLETVSSAVSTLQSDITGWSGSLLTAIPLLSAVDTLESDIKTATTDTEDASDFDDSVSSSITSEVVALESLIEATLTDLVDKESDVAAIGFTSTVKSSLNTLKTLSDDLITALEAKVVSANLTTIESAATAINSAFTSAISAF